jgi:hypothetical protein
MFYLGAGSGDVPGTDVINYQPLHRKGIVTSNSGIERLAEAREEMEYNFGGLGKTSERKRIDKDIVIGISARVQHPLY